MATTIIITKTKDLSSLKPAKKTHTIPRDRVLSLVYFCSSYDYKKEIAICI